MWMTIFSKLFHYTTKAFSNIYSYFVVIPLCLVGLAYYKQNILLYCNYLPQGSRGSYIYLPSRYNLPYEEVWITTKDNVKIHCWLIRQQTSTIQEYNQTSTIIYFHGNAGNISHRLLTAQDLYRLVKCNILLVSYRGYGKSEGEPSEEGLKLDAEAALGYILKRTDINSNAIYLFGRSLGGAVALSLAVKHQRDIRGVIIENTFTNIPEMIDVVFPYLKFFKFLSKNQWRNDECVKKLGKKLPILFISGEMDELVPPKMMKTLYETCSSNKKVWKSFASGTHNETWTQPFYYHTIAKFIQETMHTRVSHNSF